MAYQEFAYFYDEFNGAADYDALFAYVTGELKAHGIQDGIVADFGCGTGELTLMLAQAGYDMIGIDVSEEMLSVLRDKADALGLPLTNPMLLCQDVLQLDLYGTIRAAVSTFDTYNHESFSEYSYPLDTVKALLTRYGFDPVKIADGESFGPVRPDSQRWIITAVKQYTQEADGNPA